MEINQLRKFLIASNKAGYASGGEAVAQKQPDYSKTITFQGKNIYHAQYLGGLINMRKE